MAEITETKKLGNKEYPEKVYDLSGLKKGTRGRKIKKKEVKQEIQQQIIPPTTPAFDPALFKVTEQITPDQATAIVMQFMGNMDKIAMHTELTDDRIVNVMAIQSIGDQYGIKLLSEDVPNRFLPLLVSKDRKGREEIIKLIKARSSGQAQQGLMERMRGLY